jgi:SAM-dependent methyltransferase
LLLACRSGKHRRRWFGPLFEQIARRTGHVDGRTFMNYGYARKGSPQTCRLSADEEAERYCAQLYHRVVEGVDLDGKDVVEVSCGRGGGAAYLRRHFTPSTVTGIDLAPAAVAFCRRVHKMPGLRFIQGDAEALPVFDRSCDVVVNVEAASLYEDPARFFAEVDRILRPGGVFLFADLCFPEEVTGLRAALAASGLQMVEEDDIAADVSHGLELDAARRSAAVRVIVPWPLRGLAKVFVGAPGTRFPTLFASGRLNYRCFVLRKAQPAPPPGDTLHRIEMATPALA